MRPERRTVTGLLIAAILVPLFAGVLGCLPSFPVPIGDPEESWIDPAVSGLWVSQEDPRGFLFLNPWDDRTWLLSIFEVGLESDDTCAELPDPQAFGDVLDLFDRHRSCVKVEVELPLKAWLSEHGGRRFLTLDSPFRLPDQEMDEDEGWMVWRIALSDGKHLTLEWADGESEVFEDLPRSQEAYEERLAAHADDAELFDELGEFMRVPAEHRETILDGLFTFD